MIKFFSPIPDGGFPIYSPEINGVLQDQIWTPLEQQMKALVYPLAGIIVSGGVINDLGATFDIGSGICFLDGQYLEFDAVAGLTSPAYISVDTPVTTNTDYADAVSRGYTVSNKAIVTDTSPGGQTIVINTNNTSFLYFQNYIAKLQDVNDINDERSSERRSRPILVAKVDSGASMTVQYSDSGTWTASSIGTGIYEIRRGGALVANLPVLITPINNSISVTMVASYDEDNGHVIMSSTAGALTNWAFRIIAYPEV